MLRVAHGERGAVHSFFELLRVSHILSELEEHCVLCCGGSSMAKLFDTFINTHFMCVCGFIKSGKP